MGPPGSDGNIVRGRGSLYCLDKGNVKRRETNIGISNGLAWDTNTMKMYYNDTMDPVVYQYDFTDCGSIGENFMFSTI